MAEIPRVYAQPNVQGYRVPRPTAESFGAGFLGELSQLNALNNAANETEARQQAQVISARVDQAIQQAEIRFPNNSDEFEREARETSRQIVSDSIQGMTNPGAAARAQQLIQDDIIRKDITITGTARKMKLATAQADWQTYRTGLANEISKETNPVRVTQLEAQYDVGLHDIMLATGVFNPIQAQQDKQEFKKQIGTNLADNRPGEFESVYRTGYFDDLPWDDRQKLLERAEGRLDKSEKKQEAAFKEVQKVVYERWSALANNGALSDSDLQEALSGRHPYITPDQARTLRNINDGGEGDDDKVRAIMMDYHLGPSSFARIRKAREALRTLQQSGQVKQKVLDKAANELQTDERTMESIEAQRVNRNVQAAEDTYNANKPVMPFNMPLFQNQDRANQARIKDLVRQGMTPEAAAKKVLGDQKREVEQVPNTVKKVLELP